MGGVAACDCNVNKSMTVGLLSVVKKERTIEVYFHIFCLFVFDTIIEEVLVISKKKKN